MIKSFPYIFILFACLLQQPTMQAQQYDPSKINKKAVSLFEQAKNRFEDGNDVLAIGLLQKSVETDPNYADAYLTMGNLYSRMKNYNAAVASFEKAFAIDSVYGLEYRVQYAVQLAGLGKFEKALAIVSDVLSRNPPKNHKSLANAKKRQESFQFAVNFEKNHPDKNYFFAPSNLGKNINTTHPEYLPTLSVDGSELIFTRRLAGTNEDFFISKKDTNGWRLAEAAGGNINTPQSEAALTLSADGEWMIYAASGRMDSYGNYDLYMAQKENDEWKDVYHFGLGINTDQWEAQPSLSPDRKDLYFASRRPGGHGGIDIYVSHLKANGYYSEPENMGPGINTSGDDQCPFIHTDNQTLYFTSNGWPGYGDDDLFVVRKQPNGEWGQPENLGYPINTIEKEGTMCIAADGQTAYYAADRNDSYGGLDIYSFLLRKDVRPVKTIWVKGKITDIKSGLPVAAMLELTDLVSKKPVSQIQADAVGNYFMTLPIGKDYAFTINSKGYLFYSDNFLTANREPDSTFIKNIVLQPIATNATIVLKNIFFEPNKYVLNPESQTELDKLVQLLNENPTMKIEISGHTDNIGKPADNMLLSKNRAKAVVDYLISKKIAAARLIAKGYGETKPIADNKTDTGRMQNRRTEMRVINQ